MLLSFAAFEKIPSKNDSNLEMWICNGLIVLVTLKISCIVQTNSSHLLEIDFLFLMVVIYYQNKIPINF